jgi:hypothetical protein
MCDYSLYTVRNRLAEEREELVLHKFETSSLGFASVLDLEAQAGKKPEKGRFWGRLQNWMSGGSSATVPAVCIPPGAQLLLKDVPQSLQKSLRIRASQLVVFTEISSRSYSYRDALILPDGTSVLLQDLTEGIHAIVLSLSSVAPAEVATNERARLAS